LACIKGLASETGKRIAAVRRSGGFLSVADLAARAEVGAKDLGALAAAGALQGLARHRHRARWDVAGIEPSLGLFGLPRFVEAEPMLRRPSESEDIAADYRQLGISLGRHPLTLLRERFDAAGVVE